uniref:Uncharacterized protein n=2 Tax=viral metagenome TaxID=1070528 RepID=A0A6M3KUJ0_9ZZZZ
MRYLIAYTALAAGLRLMGVPIPWWVICGPAALIAAATTGLLLLELVLYAIIRPKE